MQRANADGGPTERRPGLPRRAFLGTVGGALLAGCRGGDNGEPPVDVAEMDELAATEKTCDDTARNRGTVSLDGETVRVEGTIVASAICAKPDGQVLIGSGESAGTVTVVVEASVPGERDCEACHTRIDYEGSVSLEESPDVLTLEHVTTDGDEIEVDRIPSRETATRTAENSTSATAPTRE